jgi:predicted DNA-binding transcriptional regulator AlpA
MIQEYMNLLYMKYKKLNLSRKELAHELGISLSKLEKLIAEDSFPIKYKRMGTAQKAPYIFPISEVARFLSFENIEVAA